MLVLDLDNTLLHTKNVSINELVNRTKQPIAISLIDPLRSIYEIKTQDKGMHVKLRPFLGEFLKQILDEKKFEIFFYTAATKFYGIWIIDILRMEV